MLLDLLSRNRGESWRDQALLFLAEYDRPQILACLRERLVMPVGVARILWKIRTRRLAEQALQERLRVLYEITNSLLVKKVYHAETAEAGCRVVSNRCAMISNPLNLAFRFLLELAALAALGFWGWRQAPGALGLLLAIGAPLLIGAVWGTFRAPADSPAGRPPVTVSGPLRLLIELSLFALAVWALIDAGSPSAAWLLSGAALLHYLISYRRVAQLLRG